MLTFLPTIAPCGDDPRKFVVDSIAAAAAIWAFLSRHFERTNIEDVGISGQALSNLSHTHGSELFQIHFLAGCFSLEVFCFPLFSMTLYELQPKA